MKERTIYVCEFCGLEFTEAYPKGYNECRQHEATHVKPEPYAIENSGSYQSGDKYPDHIKIPMADGVEIMYKYDYIVPIEIKECSPAIGSSQRSLKEEPLTF